VETDEWTQIDRGGATGGLEFTDVKTGAYTAEVNDCVKVNSSGGSFDVTFPTAPEDNSRIGIIDINGSLATNSVGIVSANKIDNSVDDFICDTNFGFLEFVYDESTTNWLLLEDVVNLNDMKEKSYNSLDDKPLFENKQDILSATDVVYNKQILPPLAYQSDSAYSLNAIARNVKGSTREIIVVGDRSGQPLSPHPQAGVDVGVVEVWIDDVHHRIEPEFTTDSTMDFGCSVDCEDDWIVIGARYSSRDSSNGGEVSVYNCSTGSPVFHSLLKITDWAGITYTNNDVLGQTVKISDGKIVASCGGYDWGTSSQDGAVFGWELIADTWTAHANFPVGSTADPESQTSDIMDYFAFRDQGMDFKNGNLIVGDDSSDEAFTNGGNVTIIRDVFGTKDYHNIAGTQSYQYLGRAVAISDDGDTIVFTIERSNEYISQSSEEAGYLNSDCTKHMIYKWTGTEYLHKWHANLAFQDSDNDRWAPVSMSGDRIVISWESSSIYDGTGGIAMLLEPIEDKDSYTETPILIDAEKMRADGEFGSVTSFASYTYIRGDEIFVGCDQMDTDTLNDAGKVLLYDIASVDISGTSSYFSRDRSLLATSYGVQISISQYHALLKNQFLTFDRGTTTYRNFTGSVRGLSLGTNTIEGYRLAIDGSYALSYVTYSVAFDISVATFSSPSMIYYDGTASTADGILPNPTSRDMSVLTICKTSTEGLLRLVYDDGGTVVITTIVNKGTVKLHAVDNTWKVLSHESTTLESHYSDTNFRSQVIFGSGDNDDVIRIIGSLDGLAGLAYGGKINFGDGDHCYWQEYADDSMLLYCSDFVIEASDGGVRIVDNSWMALDTRSRANASSPARVIDITGVDRDSTMIRNRIYSNDNNGPSMSFTSSRGTADTPIRIDQSDYLYRDYYNGVYYDTAEGTTEEAIGISFEMFASEDWEDNNRGVILELWKNKTGSSSQSLVYTLDGYNNFIVDKHLICGVKNTSTDAQSLTKPSMNVDTTASDLVVTRVDDPITGQRHHLTNIGISDNKVICTTSGLGAGHQVIGPAINGGDVEIADDYTLFIEFDEEDIATDTLDGAILIGDTTLTLNSASGFKEKRWIVINGDYLYVSDITGNVLTVERNVNGLTAVPHGDTAEVVMIGVWRVK